LNHQSHQKDPQTSALEGVNATGSAAALVVVTGE
jgi:hypothetical protein